MAVNRFWGQSQTAQFDPLSMQELAIAPQQMYQREQDTVAKMEAMNEAKNTINAALGDKAVIPEQFNAEYQAALGDIQKNGINPRNSAKLSQLKQLYASEVKPIEMFANERLKWDEQYMKQAMDQNNIVLGARPTTKTFDEYRKDPNALQFSVIGRDKLMTQGLLNGKEIAKSLTKEWNTADGYHHVQEGFGTAAEAMQAYQKNEKGFRDQVESRVRDLAAANGAVGHPEVEASIRQGILSSVVGEQKLMGIPGWSEMMRQKDEQAQQSTGGRSFIIKEGMKNPAPKPFDIASKTPEYKQAADNLVGMQPDFREKGIKSMDQLNNVISQLEAEGSITAPMKNAKGLGELASATGRVIDSTLDIPFEYLRGERKEKSYNGIPLSKLKDYRDKVNTSIQGEPGYTTDNMLRIDRAAIGWDKSLSPRVTEVVGQVDDELNNIIGRYATKDLGRYGATSEGELEIIDEFNKADKMKRKVQLKGVRVNASTDQKGGTRGTGYTAIVVDLINPEAKEGERTKEVTLHLPYGETSRALEAVKALGANDTEVLRYLDKSQRYYEHEQKMSQ